jgi:hypothetical protein
MDPKSESDPHPEPASSVSVAQSEQPPLCPESAPKNSAPVVRPISTSPSFVSIFSSPRLPPVVGRLSLAAPGLRCEVASCEIDLSPGVAQLSDTSRDSSGESEDRGMMSRADGPPAPREANSIRYGCVAISARGGSKLGSSASKSEQGGALAALSPNFEHFAYDAFHHFDRNFGLSGSNKCK